MHRTITFLTALCLAGATALTGPASAAPAASRAQARTQALSPASPAVTTPAVAGAWTTASARPPRARADVRTAPATEWSLTRAADGRTLIGARKGHASRIDAATLARGEDYDLPAGATRCWPVARWERTSFLEHCTGGAAPGLYSQPLDGGAPVPQAAGTAPGGGRWGEAWHTRAGAIAVAPDEGMTRRPFRLSGEQATPLDLPAGYGSRMVLRDVSESLLFFGNSAPLGTAPDHAVLDLGRRRIVPLAGTGTLIPGRVSGLMVVGSSRR